MLYLVATPIGNLEDITYRAVRILGEVDLIAAEDTRHTKKLLNHYGIETPMLSFHEHSDNGRIEEIVSRLATGSVALVSDAGTPLISDPGYRMVQAAIEAGYAVVPIPGPSATIAALSASGLPTDRFLFLGFPPKQKGKREQLIQAVATEKGTLIFYESPHRLASFLQDIQSQLVRRQIVVCRELTKRYEEFWRGSIEAGIEAFKTRDVKGEITLLIAGFHEQPKVWHDEEVLEVLRQAVEGGQSRKEAVATVAAQTGRRKRDVYQLSLTL